MQVGEVWYNGDGLTRLETGRCTFVRDKRSGIMTGGQLRVLISVLLSPDCLLAPSLLKRVSYVVTNAPEIQLTQEGVRDWPKIRRVEHFKYLFLPFRVLG